MSKTPNQVIQNLENVLASLKTKTGKSQNNLTDVVGAMATNGRAETTLVSTVNSNELVFTAKNEQKEGYVYKAADTKDIKTATVTLSVDGPTVTASHGDNKISATVATIGRADTSLGSTATNNTLVFTASNNQDTGYVLGANKTATKTVSLSATGKTVIASDGTNSISKSVDVAARATTTIAAATTNKTNELKVSATNNQAIGYVEGDSLQDNDLTISLSASGDTVSAKWGNTVVATQKVTTVGRATTDIGTVANDTNDTLTITATNSQGTGYVVADSDKNTASKVVTLSIAKPTIDAFGNVTAIATAQDNSTTPVKVSKTSNALALGIGSLSVSGNIVTTSAGYYSSATSATVATVSRATTSLGSTATNNKLVFTATNNQGTGYVVASTSANNATAEVTLSVSGSVVTASHGTNKISATVAAGAIEASATVNSPSITLTPSAITLVNKTATISGKTQVAATPTSSNDISG